VESFDTGAREYLGGDNATAIDKLTQAVRQHDDFAEAHYLLALAQLRAGARDAAIAALRKAAALTSNAMLRDYAAKKLASLGEG